MTTLGDVRLGDARRPAFRLAPWIALCALAEMAGIGLAAAWYGAVMTLFGEPTAILPRLGVLILATLAAFPEGLVLGGLQAYGLKRAIPDLDAARFVGATVAVGALGWGVGSYIPLFVVPDGPSGTSEDPSIPALILFAAIFGAVAGALFGFVQSLALPPRIERRLPWIIGNVVGWTLALPMIYVVAQLGSDLPGIMPKVAAWMAGGTLAGATIGLCTGLAVPALARRR